MFAKKTCLSPSAVRVFSESYTTSHNRPSSVTYLFRTTGQVLGVSLSGAILQAVLLQKLRQRIHGPDAAEVSDQIAIHQIIISRFYRLFMLFGILIISPVPADLNLFVATVTQRRLYPH